MEITEFESGPNRTAKAGGAPAGSKISGLHSIMAKVSPVISTVKAEKKNDFQ